MIDIDKLKVGDVIAYELTGAQNYVNHISMDKIIEGANKIAGKSIYITWWPNTATVHTTDYYGKYRDYMRRMIRALEQDPEAMMKELSVREAMERIIMKIFSAKFVSFKSDVAYR